MALKYYLKEVVSNPVLSRHGKRIPFEVFGGDWGGIILDESKPEEQELIEDLNKLRESRTGGIVPCGSDEYSSKKLQWPYQPSASQYAQPLRAYRQPGIQPSNPVGAVAASPVIVPQPAPLPNPVIPAEPPKGEVKHFKPRMSRVKAAAKAVV